MARDIDSLRAEYEEKRLLYEQLCRELTIQLAELLRQEETVLAVPIESRVKAWESVVDKCNRNNLVPNALEQIGDVAGLRIVLLFKRDQERVCGIIADNFEVLTREDTQDRLAADQFGYGSVHFELRPKQEWFSLPTLRKLQGLQAEVQVRTASQHIWAAASHTLQYKRESHVPLPVRRAINRVAALLEMVDLEFERVLSQRGAYAAQLDQVGNEEPLNVDVLRKILADTFPPENADETLDERGLSELLDELTAFDILSAASFRDLMGKRRADALSAEAEVVAALRTGERNAQGKTWISHPDRLAKGVFFSHVGLARQTLEAELGDKYSNFLMDKANKAMEERMNR